MEIKVSEMKNSLNQVLERVEKGGEVFISREGVIIAKISPFRKPLHDRVLGTEKGKVVFGDEFFQPLPEEILREFNK